ncbi:MAG: hypothetical protein RQ761_13040 [Bacteroidales bacterium]|nr:hypothetical protein [Bacteroidales bacterium]
MKNNFLLYISLLAISMFSIPIFVNAQVFIDIEPGVVFTGYNDVQIPGDTGTAFSLKDDLNAEPSAFVRLRAGITLGSRHTISVLYAPLKVKSEGLSDKEIDFNGIRFPVNTQLNAIYKFNSYRITYRYDIVKRPKFEFGLGFTAKIRDAEIELSGQGLSSSKKNVGFVPIINFRLYWKMNEKIGILLEGDALAAPQGRAEDVLLAATYKFSDHFLFRIGYRILEGGADNDEVYNFALFHYASLGISYTF